MDNNNFNKGIFLTALGSFWWGFFGVIYFKYISFVGHIEVVIHRSFWTTITLLITTFIFSKCKIFFILFNNKVMIPQFNTKNYPHYQKLFEAHITI